MTVTKKSRKKQSGTKVRGINFGRFTELIYDTTDDERILHFVRGVLDGSYHEAQFEIVLHEGSNPSIEFSYQPTEDQVEIMMADD